MKVFLLSLSLSLLLTLTLLLNFKHFLRLHNIFGLDAVQAYAYIFTYMYMSIYIQVYAFLIKTFSLMLVIGQ